MKSRSTIARSAMLTASASGAVSTWSMGRLTAMVRRVNISALRSSLCSSSSISREVSR